MATRGAFQWTLVWLCLSAVKSGAASETTKSYYDILDVEQTASESQIKKSFRRLAVRYHPDKNKSADSETIFRDIAEGKPPSHTHTCRCSQESVHFGVNIHNMKLKVLSF